ncbi:MAG: orotate phosphoribosyltransferase [Thermoplasmata archaeon]|nr:MAG: orotate phosphoribosyltransferase [Thermoplasmata archaeon]
MVIRMVNIDLVDALKGCGAVKFGDFVLASGKRSSYYIDIKIALTKPEILAEIARRMVKLLDGDKVAGMELGAVPIATAVAMLSHKEMVIIRKREKGHGLSGRIIGDVSTGDRITVVEDVTTTGGSLIDAINVLRAVGGEVKRALVVVDRDEGAVDELKKIGVELVPLLTAKELLRGEGIP